MSLRGTKKGILRVLDDIAKVRGKHKYNLDNLRQIGLYENRKKILGTYADEIGCNKELLFPEFSKETISFVWEKYGGSFLSTLGLTLKNADVYNEIRIVTSFYDYICDDFYYDKMMDLELAKYIKF